MPALFGLPALGSLFLSIFSSAASFFVTHFTTRFAFRVFAVSIVVALLVVFVDTSVSLLSSIQQQLPSFILIPASWIVPSNLSACLTAIFTALGMRWLLALKVKFALFKAS